MNEMKEIPGTPWVTSMSVVGPLHAANHTGRYIIAKRPSFNLYAICFEIQFLHTPPIYQNLGQNLTLRQALKALEGHLRYYIERSE